jgi:hypothetical protein
MIKQLFNQLVAIIFVVAIALIVLPFLLFGLLLMLVIEGPMVLLKMD